MVCRQLRQLRCQKGILISTIPLDGMQQCRNNHILAEDTPCHAQRTRCHANCTGLVAAQHATASYRQPHRAGSGAATSTGSAPIDLGCKSPATSLFTKQQTCSWMQKQQCCQWLTTTAAACSLLLSKQVHKAANVFNIAEEAMLHYTQPEADNNSSSGMQLVAQQAYKHIAGMHDIILYLYDTNSSILSAGKTISIMQQRLLQWVYSGC